MTTQPVSQTRARRAEAPAQPAAPQIAPGTLSRRSFEVIDGIGDLTVSYEGR